MAKKKKVTKKKAGAAKSAKPAKSAKAAAPAKVSPVAAASKVRTKGEVFRVLAEQTGASRKQVASMFDVMKDMIAKDLSKKGPGVFSVPGMMKVTVKRMPATKAREGINPFTGEKTTFKAKPARNVVKVRPLKGLKELV